jgi:hypothetical protein
MTAQNDEDSLLRAPDFVGKLALSPESKLKSGLQKAIGKIRDTNSGSAVLTLDLRCFGRDVDRFAIEIGACAVSDPDRRSVAGLGDIAGRSSATDQRQKPARAKRELRADRCHGEPFVHVGATAPAVPMNHPAEGFDPEVGGAICRPRFRAQASIRPGHID